jgi:hypothetical protein
LLNVMAASKLTRDAPNPRGRTITTILVIMIAAMIVRDILARRWGSSSPPPPSVTQRPL